MRGGWTVKDGKIEANTTVLIFSPSGETSLTFAHQVRHSHGRPAASKARMVIGIGSEASRAFTEGTGLYDLVLCYDSDSSRDAKDLGNVLSLQEDAKVVICDFGSRGGAADRWAEKLRRGYGNVVQGSIVEEVVADNPEEVTRKFLERVKD